MKFIVFILLILSLIQAEQIANQAEIKIQDQAQVDIKSQTSANSQEQAQITEKSQVQQDPEGDLFMGENGEGEGLQARAMHKILFGVDEKQRYSYDVEYVHKFQAFFPLFEPGKESSQLNKFNWKYVFLYADHLSVFKDDTQDEPPKLLSDIKKKVGQKEFLNNYPISIFLTPCDGQLCTVSQFKKYYNKLNPQNPFQIEQRVLKALGPSAEEECFLLIKDLLVPKEYFYVCQQRKDVLLHMKFAIEEAQSHIQMEEQSTQCSYILPSKNDIIKIYLHLDKDRLVGNNRPEQIDEGKKIQGYYQYFKYSIQDEFFTPAAEPIPLRRGNEIQWNGDQTLKPDKARCIELNLKFKDPKDESIFLGHETICFFSSSDGSRPIDLNFAKVIADQWAQKINKVTTLAKLKSTQDYIKTCDEPECLVSLTCKNPIMAPIFEFVHHNAVRIEKVCRDLNIAFQLDLPTCHYRKQKDIIFNIEQVCQEQEGCMKIVADCIEQGFVPLNDDNHSVSWDRLNLYRNLDAANVVVPVVTPDMFPPTKDEIANYSQEQKQQWKIKQELGIPGVPEPKITLKFRPSILEIQTALATFRLITQGKKYKSMFGMLSSCKIRDADKGLNRQVSLVPFIARFDPWIEFMGNIADTENVV